MSEEKDPNEILVDYVCPNCCLIGTLYSNAYESWDREEQKSVFEEGETWYCGECNSGVYAADINLPRKVWDIINTQDVLGSTEEIYDAFMNMPKQATETDTEVTYKMFEKAYREQARFEEIPDQKVEETLTLIKTYIDL